MKRLMSVAATAAVIGMTACGDEDMMTPPEETTFRVTIENVSTAYDFAGSGSFAVPAGSGGPGPLMPGGVYEFEFDAFPGARLSFATMFVQSNDLFYAPDGAGIELFDGAGAQVTGDVTDQVMLWDAGTEIDQEPGSGADQAPRQGGADSGADDAVGTVRLATDDFGNLPDVSEVISVMLDATGPTSFRLRIENVSEEGTVTTVPLAPGVWVVHTDDDPLFTVGEADRGEGLEGLAEDGANGDLADALADRTGLTGPIAPGVYAVHAVPSGLFAAGSASSSGLEALAEDGDPSGLAGAVDGAAGISVSGAFDTPVGAAGAAPAFPGEEYEFTVTAVPGDRLSFATMFVQSNDLFFAPSDGGIDLFPGGSALSGDVTGMVLLWDAGTEVNEAPGFGLNQAPRQAGPDTGDDEAGVVRQVSDGYVYPAVGDVIRVTVQPGA